MTVDNLVKVGGVVAAILTIVMGQQVWYIRAELRKRDTETGRTKAETDKTAADYVGALGAATVQLLEPYDKVMGRFDHWAMALNSRADAMENYIDLMVDWETDVVRRVNESPTPMNLPAPPPRPAFGPRPPFSPLMDRSHSHNPPNAGGTTP